MPDITEVGVGSFSWGRWWYEVLEFSLLFGRLGRMAGFKEL